MGTNAMGITDPDELARIAQEVPAHIKSKCCSLCLWRCVECQKGSMLAEKMTSYSGDKTTCTAYTYYD
jgi:hypothetical protein